MGILLVFYGNHSYKMHRFELQPWVTDRGSEEQIAALLNASAYGEE